MIDLLGKKFNKLTVLSRISSTRSGSITWKCLCECGDETVLSSDHLTRKNKPVKSCGCLRKLSGKDHKDWKGCGDISGAWWAIHIVREIFQTRRPKIEVDLTIEFAWDLFLKQDGKCALSAISIKFDRDTKYNTASLDRIDSSQGYTRANIQWVHKDINFMKRIYSQEYFIEMCRKVANNSIKNE